MINREEFVSIGDDVYIHDSVIIKNPGSVKLGSHIAIDNGVTISTQLEVGNYVHISPYCCFIGGRTIKITLRDFAFVAAGTKIIAGSERYTGEGLVNPTIPIEYRSLIFEEVVFDTFSGCGVNCSILPGVTLGEGAILGANSLATHDLEPWTIYVGSPAKPLRVRRKDIILKNARELGYEG
jgi:acetyltransferase-like isoleucine patch superfamily enzyme